MKPRLIWMLALMAGSACSAGDAVRSNNKARIDWQGQSFRDVTYKQVGERKLLMDIYLPDDHKSDKAPVIYYVHGGGWAAGNKEKF